MKEIKIIVKDNLAHLYGRVNLIAGTVGQTCLFYFDDSWNNLNKKVSYKIGTNVVGTYDITDNKTIIPSQILAMSGFPLEIGITGRSDDGSIVIPTAWCYIDTIKQGSTPYVGGSGDDVIYDGGTVEKENPGQHIIYDGGVIS